MALESASQIQDLVDTNPEGTDDLAEADNHLRMIKKCIQTSLPGMTAPLTFTGVIKAADPVADTDLVTKQFLAAHFQPWVIGRPEMWLVDALPVVSGQVFMDLEGQAISRTTYADLFALFGIIYGLGDGSTTFNLPDLRGMFLRVRDNLAGIDPDAATRSDRGDGTTGDAVGTRQVDTFESHTHTYVDQTTNQGGAAAANFNVKITNYTANSGATGGSETRPINIGVRYIMRVS